MKKIILAAAVAVASLAGCIAVPYEPAPYYSAPGYYYPAPAPAVSLYYSNRGGYYGHRHRW